MKINNNNNNNNNKAKGKNTMYKDSIYYSIQQ